MFAVNTFDQTLATIATRLNEKGITWWIGASSALYVQGVAVEPKDLDIIVDVSQFDQAYAALQELQPGDITTGDFAGETYHKAELNNTAFPAEIAGFTPDGSPLVTIERRGVAIVVHPLDVELAMYKKRSGKEHVVALIEETIASKQLLVVNEKELVRKHFPAHGGKGVMDIGFAFTEYERFSNDNDSGWSFFGVAELPEGATAGLHLHEGEDEFFYILEGEADIIQDGTTTTVRAGDIVLTRSGSIHGITAVRKKLKFITIEIARLHDISS